jgi:hypothetical protein
MTVPRAIHILLRLDGRRWVGDTMALDALHRNLAGSDWDHYLFRLKQEREREWRFGRRPIRFRWLHVDLLPTDI